MAGTMRRAGVTRRMRPAEDDAVVVRVESEDVTAAKTMMAGKMGANTVEAEAMTAMADMTAETEDAMEDVTVSKDASEESMRPQPWKHANLCTAGGDSTTYPRTRILFRTCPNATTVTSWWTF